MSALKLQYRRDDSPQQVWLEIPLDQTTQDHPYSNDVARRNAYISRLCLDTLIPWLRSESDDEIAMMPSLESIWEFLPGAMIQLGQTKLALIPSEIDPADQFCVPFEWVDIPNWAADYYLAIQMNLEEDERWLRIWGFTTHQRLKAGDTNTVKRLYQLDRADLIENFNVFWTARSLNLEPALPPMNVPTLSLDRLESLLDQLSEPTLYSPRLEVPFDQWAALLSNDRWRQLLYQRRQPVEKTEASNSPVNLRQWLNQTVEETWQAIEAILALAQLSPARSTTQANSSDAIAPILRLVKSTASEQIRQQAAGVLGEIGTNQPEVIDALVELLQTAQQEETRWQAALSLGKIAPQHPLAGVRRARVVDLGLQLDRHAIALIVAIMPRHNDRLGVFLQVQSVTPQSPLPPHLTVSVLSDSGETRLKAEARSDEQANGKDQSLELRFSPPTGTRFQVKVALNDAFILEEFLA